MNGAVVLAFFLASAAQADQTIRVPLSQGSAPFSAEKLKIPAAPASEMSLALAVSSWSPEELRLDSQLPDSSSFATHGLPSLSAALTLPPLLRGSSGQLSLRTGLTYLGLRRSGTLRSATSTETLTQDANLFSAEAGLEARPALLQWRRAGMYLDAALLPSLLITRRSAFGDGRAIAGLPARFALGWTFDLAGSLSWSTPLWMDVGVAQLFGNESEGSLNGAGVHAGVRLAI